MVISATKSICATEGKKNHHSKYRVINAICRSHHTICSKIPSTSCFVSHNGSLDKMD